MLEKISTLFIIVFALCVILEFIWAKVGKQAIYNLNESLCNISTYVIHVMIRPLALGWGFIVYAQFLPLQPFTLPDTAWAFALTFVATDLAYYWYHRLTHELPILWTMHHTHHSSRKMNLTSAVRLNWVARFVTPLFFLPLIFLGMSPLWVFISLGLGLFYQFFLHTEAIGKLGWFEGKLLNTPAAHRVHHGYNAPYRNKNYAGALIIWDRLFGTYQEEHETSTYGVNGFESQNPLKVQFAQMGQYLKSLNKH